MLKKKISVAVSEAVKKAAADNKLGQIKVSDEFNLTAETPKNYDFGDFAVNISQLSRFAKLPPAVIAETVKEYINFPDAEINTVAGFINFKLGTAHIAEVVREIISRNEHFVIEAMFFG